MRLALSALLLIACADEAARNTTNIDNVMGVEMDAATQLDAAPAPAARDARVSATGLGCPALWDECPTQQPWRVIVRADRFGAGARFTALAGDLALVQADTWRVVQVGPDLTPGEPSFVRSTALPAGEWEAHGLARTDGIAVIACGERCVLLEGALGDATLRTTPGSELPAGYDVRGLQAASGALCVFGSDVSCFAGGRWQRTLDEDVMALALAPRSVALTRSGRVFSALLDGALPRWVEEAPAVGFSAVAASGRRALFSNEHAWQERTDGQDYACEVPTGIAAVLTAFGGSPSLLTGRGDVLSVRAGGFCRTQQLSVDAVLGASSGPCGGEPRIITASQLIGDNRCDQQ